jgi:hypothetical protein
VLGLTACGGPETAPAARTPTTPSATPPAADAAADPDQASFATSVSADGRYFVDQRGTPWFGLGDSPWSLFGQLDRHEADVYLDDRAARGFNLLLTSVVENHYSDDPPNNAAGDPPFVGKIFRSEPNEAYWEWVDYVVEAARARGITLLLCPAYLGFHGADDGLEDEVADASEDDMAAYGQFLADRYGGFPNIMWLIGHDQAPSAALKAREEALARELPPSQLVGVGGTDDGLLGSADWSPTTIDVDFETVYSYRFEPVLDVQTAWRQEPTRPVLFLEGRYEQEPDARLGAELLRLQEYGAFGGGAAAVMFGNNPIWNFEGNPLSGYEGSWQDNLDSLGSRDAALFGSLVRSLDWSPMAPDLENSLLGAGAGRAGELAGVRRSTREGFVYLPSPRPTTLDLSVFAGVDQIEIQRVDPRSGARTDLGTHPTSAAVTLPDPGRNAAGDDDWVYLLTPPR